MPDDTLSAAWQPVVKLQVVKEDTKPGDTVFVTGSSLSHILERCLNLVHLIAKPSFS